MVIFAATTWLALRASQVKRRILGIVLALIPLVRPSSAIILAPVGNDDTAQPVNKILTILLVVVAPVAILRRLVEHPVTSLNTFYGAVCVTCSSPCSSPRRTGSSRSSAESSSSRN